MTAGIFKNRVTEKDVRTWLDRNGFFGRSAEISDLELHAIQRPGWKQIFRFTVDAKPKLVQADSGSEDADGPEDQDLPRVVRYGVVLDDQRKRTEAEQTQVVVFESMGERDEELEELSVGMLTCSAGQNGGLYVLAIVVFAFVVVSLVLGSLVGN